tara:strand:- start:458 stop:616 length:159 start_codon:yes stop_codon:yes gene_type:complete
MKNILGHTRDVKLYAACGNVRYQYTNTEGFVEETYFNNAGEITGYRSKNHNE